MSHRVRLRQEAEQDLTAAATWYERQQIALGQGFLDEFMSVRDRLVDVPLIYPIVHKNIHRGIANRFPFGICLVVDGDEIVIIAIMHGSRNPRQWQTRT